MYSEFANACILAREDKKITQEKLSELCGISRNSVSNYELGKSLPEEDVAVVLIEKLEDPYVGYAYLRSSKVGKLLLPDIPQRHLASSVLDLQIEMNDVSVLHIDLARIGIDNRVDQTEKPIGERCRREIIEMIGSGFSVFLSLWKKSMWQKEKTPMLAHRR